MASIAQITHRLYTGDISYDFMKNRKIWYTFTGILLAICVLALAIFGLRLGVEFSGGTEFTVHNATVTDKTVDEYRTAVQALGLAEMDDLAVTTSATTSGTSEVHVQTRALTGDDLTVVRETLATQAGQDVDEVTYDSVGASWGAQITQKGLIALVVFLALVSVLIGVYFRDFKMAVAAILALMHDLLVTVGVYAIVGFSVTPATLIGMLTILGYSLYDTVVVFDKVRENVADIFNGRESYSELANKAVNQVLVRSLNTTIVGVLPVAALTFTGTFILGTGPLKDLGLALLVGMIAGTYSSIFIATPLLAQMREVEPAMVEHRKRIARRAAKQAWKAASEDTVPQTVASYETFKVTAAPSEADEVAEVGVVPVEAVQAVRSQPARRSRSQRKK
ncbi:MAG: protein translocase subunit SecF [Propionibacteriaceae bacterium]|jgi:preprotein translocase subunit SecF|nr:protein translocase subunit SecF [Propionibacteriaceae bacterium]